jgi:hypothetical protein
VTAAWKSGEALRKAREAAEGLLAGRGTKTLAQAVEAAKAAGDPGAASGSTGFFRRLQILSDTQPPLSQGEQTSLIMAVFTLKAPGDVAPRPVPIVAAGSEGFLALALEGFRPAPEAAFKESEAARREQASQNASNAGYSFWSSSRTSELRLTLPTEIQRQLSSGSEAAAGQ